MRVSPYAWSVLAFFIGSLAGLQGIIQRYGSKHFVGSLRTLAGVAYLLSRGALPAAAFCVLLSRNLLPITSPWLLALAVGASAELILRTRILIGQTTEGQGPPREILYGPLVLLLWLENFFLDEARAGITKRRLREGEILAQQCVSYSALCNAVQARISVLDDTAQEEAILAKLLQLQVEGHDDITLRRAAVHYLIGQLSIATAREILDQ